MPSRQDSRGSLRGALQRRAIATTPVAVVDVETTGLYPRRDQIVEVAVIRIEPDQEHTEMVVSSLVRPTGRVRATHIHGLTDEDVADAPRFSEIAAEVMLAVRGCLVVGYNAYFDVAFLQREFARLGARFDPPFACAMYLRKMLGFGDICTLVEARSLHGLRATDAHTAADDASACADLWLALRQRMHALGLVRFQDLEALGQFRFLDSLARGPVALSASRHSSFGRAPSKQVSIGWEIRRRRIRSLWEAARDKEAMKSLIAARAELASVRQVLESVESSGTRPSRVRLGMDLDRAAWRLLGAHFGLVLAGGRSSAADWRLLTALNRRLVRSRRRIEVRPVARLRPKALAGGR
jgi:DNA polymerase III subunit epsilon